MNNTYIVYQPNGIGSFLQVGEPYTDLQLAIDGTPQGGRIEQITATGSTVVFPAPVV